MTMTFEKGTLYHVRWHFPQSERLGGEFYGVYHYDEQGAPRFWQPAEGRFVAVKHGKVIVEATPLDAHAMIERLPLYQRVHIFKYGSTYTGTIVGRARTRVCVTFRTRGGKDKTQWVPALEVSPLTNSLRV